MQDPGPVGTAKKDCSRHCLAWYRKYRARHRNVVLVLKSDTIQDVDVVMRAQWPETHQTVPDESKNLVEELSYVHQQSLFPRSFA